MINHLSFFGQPGYPYVKQWKLIDTLMNKKDLPKSALSEVNKVYESAKRERNEGQWIKSIIYKNFLQSKTDLDISDVITSFQNEITSAPPRVAAVLQSMEAEHLYQYLQGHRYQFRNRTNIEGDTSKDVTTWSSAKMNAQIRSLFISSISDEEVLKKTPVDYIDAALVPGNARDLKPSLYDFLCYRALEYFTISDEWISPGIESDLYHKSELFSEAAYFMHVQFTAKDSNSNFLIALGIFQKLLKFHAKDKHVDAWIYADIKRIQFARQYAKMPNSDFLYMQALERITSLYGSLSVVGQAWYLQARWWSDKADTYDPIADSSHRFDYVKAVAICEKVIKHPDPGEGKSNCELLLHSIRLQNFSLTAEHVNLPDLPFRVLVNFKNIDRLYFRIVRIDEGVDEIFRQNINDFSSWSKLLHRPVQYSSSQPFPETADFQNHKVEVKINPLPVGQYYLIASSDSSFSAEATMGLTGFFVSSIAYVQNDLDYFLVNRESGLPLKDVLIRSFVQKYEKNAYNYVAAKNYHSDVNGYFRMDQLLGSNIRLDFSIGNDFFSTRQYTYTPYVNSREKKEKYKLTNFLFTDRSIYRPGQTVFFKGLMLSKDLQNGKWAPAIRERTTIYLVDVNNQQVDSLDVVSNEFGSVNGIFHLPKDRLNGIFHLRDDRSQSDQEISVEEYQRPNFRIEFDTLKNSYSIGDEVRLTGVATAYAGNNISGASLIYRIVRESRFPYPWMFSRYPSVREIQMAEGISQTDNDGRFSIVFKALPDDGVDRNSLPVYTYRAEVTVTDVNGESRSSTTQIDISYLSFQIASSLPFQSRITRDSLLQIPVTTTNTSGVFIKQQVTTSMYKLKEPDRLIRKRYWDQPDQFVMTASDFIQSFPNDEYRNESDIITWAMGEKVFEKTDSTRQNGLINLNKKIITTLKTGWYLLEFKATDKTGKEITDKKYIEIVDTSGKSTILSYNLIAGQQVVSEPGHTVTIETGSSAENVFVIRSMRGINDSLSRYSFFNLNQNIKLTSISIGEKDRGGLAVNDVFVKNNRWYISAHRIEVPFSNKELQISYSTWKDKVHPGSKELWKIKISGYKKDKMAAEVLTSMYDASLDQFKIHSWEIPDIYPLYSFQINWDDKNNFDAVYSSIRPVQQVLPEVYQYRFDALIQLQPDVFSPIVNLSRRYAGGAMQEAPAPRAMKKNQVLDSVGEHRDNETATEGNTSTSPDLQVRKNFNETAFFQPDLITDAEGNVEISFTMPEALTLWKWMVFAHTKDLSFAYAQKNITAQKELMLQTNMPRFFRQGDTLQLPVKIVNLSPLTLTGNVVLEWIDPEDGKVINQSLGAQESSLPFDIAASKTGVIFFPVVIPVGRMHPVVYRVTAKAGVNGVAYSDGEENIIPVLENRMLVTESLPLNMNGRSEQDFSFDKLISSGQNQTLRNQSLTVEYTSNPAWTAIQALPYLMQYPYDCAEQTFNKFYANAIARYVVQSSPAIRKVFEKWKTTDSAALQSNLQKNEELKMILLKETPWLEEAQSETLQKQAIAFLFDSLKMQETLRSTVDKLLQIQSDGGGFPWFYGGPDDRYITQYIVSGIGKLKKLNAVSPELQVILNKIAVSAISYVDKQIKADYDKRDKSAKAINLSSLQIQYLYMRSFYSDVAVPGNIFSALNYFRGQVISNWTKQSVYMQGMIGLFLQRTGDRKTATSILNSLRENAIASSSQGTYWKIPGNGIYWQNAPVETQSLLIEAFQELGGDTKSIDQMKYWLLQQKQTNRWSNTRATADACYALLIHGSDWLSDNEDVNIQLGSQTISNTNERAEAGTGYFKKVIPGDQIKADMGHIAVHVKENITGRINPSWGAVYWQYFENFDQITSAKTGLSIDKTVFLEKNSDKGPILEALSSLNKLRPGDKLKIRLVIRSDRDLEYVHLKDSRAACFEPANVLSQYKWQDGLGYYETTGDASTSFFFDHIPKGSFDFEYSVFVTTSGDYSNGISTIECMYAPEFSAHSQGMRIQIEE